MAEVLEIMMLICFGCSWPLNVIKSYRARTTKGKSLWFLILIITGYVCGIVAKFVSDSFVFAEKWYVLLFYFLNLFMVCADLVLYFRNARIDRLKK